MGGFSIKLFPVGRQFSHNCPNIRSWNSSCNHPLTLTVTSAFLSGSILSFNGHFNLFKVDHYLLPLHLPFPSRRCLPIKLGPVVSFTNPITVQFLWITSLRRKNCWIISLRLSFATAPLDDDNVLWEYCRLFDTLQVLCSSHLCPRRVSTKVQRRRSSWWILIVWQLKSVVLGQFLQRQILPSGGDDV